MNPFPRPHRNAIRSKSAPTLAAGAMMVVLLFLSVWVCWSFGANRLLTLRTRPAGQLEADARSVRAAFAYLLDRETVSGAPAASPTLTAFCNSNSIAQSALSASVCISNQSDFLSESITNEPARS